MGTDEVRPTAKGYKVGEESLINTKPSGTSLLRDKYTSAFLALRGDGDIYWPHVDVLVERSLALNSTIPKIFQYDPLAQI